MMYSRILTIGDELLQGFTVDTNSSWLSKELYSCRIDTKYISTIGDDPDAIKNELNLIINSDYDYVFITGGLGPTHDDLTINIFSEFFKLNKSIDSIYLRQLEERFKNRGIKMTKANESQAIVLDKCIAINNPIGTARSIYYKYNKIKFFVLPGVPSEMREIFSKEIKPNYLETNYSDRIKIIKTSGKPESYLFGILNEYIKNCNYKIGFLPHFSGVNVKIERNDKVVSPKQFDEYCYEIYDRLKPFSYGWGADTLESLIVKLLTKNNKTIAVSESCTGGLLSKTITDVSGASDIFLGGVVAYNNKIKTSVLNIHHKNIEKYGSVHQIIAKEMAKNVSSLFGSDIGVGITGISGPHGASKEKPLGLVYICIYYNNQYLEKKFIFPYGRDIHRNMTVQTVFNMLRRIDMSYN